MLGRLELIRIVASRILSAESSSGIASASQPETSVYGFYVGDGKTRRQLTDRSLGTSFFVASL
jgi:hypothetical protein